MQHWGWRGLGDHRQSTMVKKPKMPLKGEENGGLIREAEALCPPDRVKEKLVPHGAASPASSLGIGFPIPVTCTLKIKTYLSF